MNQGKESRNTPRTTHHMAVLGLMLALVLALMPPVLAQETPNLFSAPSEAVGDLSDAQSEVLERLQSAPTTEAIRVVRLEPELLTTADSLTLNLFEGNDVLVTDVRTEVRSGTDLSWFGDNPKTLSSAVLSVVQGSVIGTVRDGEQLFWVRPLGDGLHAVVQVDPNAFPEEHPPEFQELENEDTGTLDLAPQDEDTAADEGSIVTVLVAYTPAARSDLGGTAAIRGLIQVAVDETNQSFANSGVNPRLQLVESYETNYPESGNMVTDRNRFRDDGDGFMDEVHDRRDAANADLALLVTAPGGFCGIAADILATEATAFAVVAHNCATGYYSFGHEIGHLFGARHNPEADSTTTPFAYGHGFFFQPEQWRTVMSYNCPGGCTRLPYWSDPLVAIGGQASGSAATHHNARVLNETAARLANFRQSTAAADRLGYVWANNPAAASYTPSVAYSHNSAGSPISITRAGVGSYRVSFADLGGGRSFGGNVQVSGYGSGSDMCKVASWGASGSNFDVNVRCFNAGGAPTNASYTVLVTWPQ